MKHLSGKTALVTGAAMGMGKCISQLLLQEGCKVALVDINEKALEKTAGELASVGKCRSYACDISDNDSVVKLGEAVEQELGRVSLLVNNAGIVVAAPLLKMPAEKIKNILDVNLASMFWTTRVFLPGMIKNGGGHIINMASAGGILAIPNLSAYCASKFGVIGFSDALRQEMKKNKYRVGVTHVCPNTVGTGMFKGSKMVAGTKELDPLDVSQKIVEAVKKNQAVLGVPSVPVKFVTPLMKVLLPAKMMDFLNRVLGMWKINDTWQGR